MDSFAPPYLEPYAAAARHFGAGFSALLWASPKTQRQRFEAIVRAEDLTDRFVLDVGCGRSDLLEFLAARHIRLARYAGIEAMPEMAEAARVRSCGTVSID